MSGMMHKFSSQVCKLLGFQWKASRLRQFNVGAACPVSMSNVQCAMCNVQDVIAQPSEHSEGRKEHRVCDIPPRLIASPALRLCHSDPLNLPGN